MLDATSPVAEDVAAVPEPRPLLRDASGRYLRGNPPGPGRPRIPLGETFREALRTTFEELVPGGNVSAGLEALRRLRDNHPDKYFALIASVVPRTLEAGEGGGASSLVVTFVRPGGGTMEILDNGQ
jgi:hypothetical protein